MQLTETTIEQTLDSGLPEGILITGDIQPGYESILTQDALNFIATLHRQFESQRQALLQKRIERQAKFDLGNLPNYISETKNIREVIGPLRQFPQIFKIDVLKLPAL